MTSEDSGIDPLWHLHDEFTVDQAAALIAGYDPSHVFLSKNDSSFENDFPKFYVAKSSLINAINSGSLKATIRRDARMQGFDEFPNYDEGSRVIPDEEEAENFSYSKFDSCVIYSLVPNWEMTTITLDHLKEWLTSRRVPDGFFFSLKSQSPEYLDPQNRRYAPKLAAAVSAWVAVVHPGKTSPRQALEKWLKDHATEFGLVDELGKPVTQAVEECSKVANWKPGGGAPKSLGE